MKKQIKILPEKMDIRGSMWQMLTNKNSIFLLVLNSINAFYSIFMIYYIFYINIFNIPFFYRWSSKLSINYNDFISYNTLKGIRFILLAYIICLPIRSALNKIETSNLILNFIKHDIVNEYTFRNFLSEKLRTLYENKEIPKYEMDEHEYYHKLVKKSISPFSLRALRVLFLRDIGVIFSKSLIALSPIFYMQIVMLPDIAILYELDDDKLLSKRSALVLDNNLKAGSAIMNMYISRSLSRFASLLPILSAWLFKVDSREYIYIIILISFLIKTGVRLFEKTYLTAILLNVNIKQRKDLMEVVPYFRKRHKRVFI